MTTKTLLIDRYVTWKERAMNTECCLLSSVCKGELEVWRPLIDRPLMDTCGMVVGDSIHHSGDSLLPHQLHQN